MTAKDTSASAPVASARGRKRALPLLFGVAVVLYAADQLSKLWVVANLPEGETVPVLGDFLQWHFTRNPGAAFSLASGQTWFFTLVAIAVICVIVWQARKIRSLWWALWFGMLLGGVLGNLTDRLFREPGFGTGHVIDFILTPWMWLGFAPAIYNVADMAIVCSMVIFFVLMVRGVSLSGERSGKEAASVPAATSAEEPDSSERGES